MLYEAGLPQDKCFFVMPENLELASKLVSDERVDFFSFIGSAKVGWMLRSKLSAWNSLRIRTWWHGTNIY